MKKQDPRIQRTRQSIMNGFMRLIKQKEFSDITIADITQEAEINRSTFYYHFMDKYDLIDEIQREVLTKEIFKEVALQEVIDEQTIIMSLQAIMSSQIDLSLQCQHALEEFKSKMDHEIKQRLTETLQALLDKEYGVKEEHYLLATFWSWGIYGVAMACVEGKETLHTAVNRLTTMILG
ncbi:TetR/AcrR family transcriptional regulator [Peribacillus sp. NPDC046944]|uniref:TetR/AcrR family transcriptional regulator n=1 Tax=unclassified Peribacillus TaxID=2675266 RepID=UPI00380CA781